MGLAAILPVGETRACDRGAKAKPFTLTNIQLSDPIPRTNSDVQSGYVSKPFTLTGDELAEPLPRDDLFGKCDFAIRKSKADCERFGGTWTSSVGNLVYSDFIDE